MLPGVRNGKILAVATHATDDPTKSSLAFITAGGALGAGKEVGIALLGEAVYLAKPMIANSVHVRRFPAIRGLLKGEYKERRSQCHEAAITKW